MQICRTIYIVFSASGNIISLKTANQLQVFLAISFVSFYVFSYLFFFFFLKMCWIQTSSRLSNNRCQYSTIAPAPWRFPESEQDSALMESILITWPNQVKKKFKLHWLAWLHFRSRQDQSEMTWILRSEEEWYKITNIIMGFSAVISVLFECIDQTWGTFSQKIVSYKSVWQSSLSTLNFNHWIVVLCKWAVSNNSDHSCFINICTKAVAPESYPCPCLEEKPITLI